MNQDAILKYSIQLAYLKQLLESGLINEKEYFLIKTCLMKDYGIASDLSA